MTASARCYSNVRASHVLLRPARRCRVLRRTVRTLCRLGA